MSNKMMTLDDVKAATEKTNDRFADHEDVIIARDRNNAKGSCMKNSLSPANGGELAAQSWRLGTGKKTREEVDARGCPVFMAAAE